MDTTYKTLKNWRHIIHRMIKYWQVLASFHKNLFVFNFSLKVLSSEMDPAEIRLIR